MKPWCRLQGVLGRCCLHLFLFESMGIVSSRYLVYTLHFYLKNTEPEISRLLEPLGPCLPMAVPFETS